MWEPFREMFDGLTDVADGLVQAARGIEQAGEGLKKVIEAAVVIQAEQGDLGDSVARLEALVMELVDKQRRTEGGQ